MKTMKKALTLVFILVLSAALAACGSSSSKEIDAQALADELMEKVEFVDELSPVKSEMVPKLYGIDNAQEAYVYMGSGATAEEVAVFKFSDEQAAEDGLAKLQDYVAARKDSFANYIPGEVARLDNAVIKQSGEYLALCVSEGNTASEIISRYMGK